VHVRTGIAPPPWGGGAFSDRHKKRQITLGDLPLLSARCRALATTLLRGGCTYTLVAEAFINRCRKYVCGSARLQNADPTLYTHTRQCSP
jgi:hypothetical protein